MQMWVDPVKIVETRARRTRTRRVLRPYATLSHQRDAAGHGDRTQERRCVSGHDTKRGAVLTRS